MQTLQLVEKFNFLVCLFTVLLYLDHNALRFEDGVGIDEKIH